MMAPKHDDLPGEVLAIPQRDCSPVAVVINCFNDLEFLPQAIDSVVGQTAKASEIIVVDDGSLADPAPLVGQYPGIRLIRQANAGLAAARNTGLAAVSSEYVLFLDADDRLLPEAIAAGLACFTRVPEAALVYGGHRRINVLGAPISPDCFRAVGEAPYEDLLRDNHIGMHATVLYKTERLRQAGGFDSALRRCEDYDLYLRLARDHSVACHPTIIAEYRRHGNNMSHNAGAMLRSVLAVHRRHAGSTSPAIRRAWKDGRQNWRKYYAKEIALSLRAEWRSRRDVRCLAQLGKEFLMASTSWAVLRSGIRRLGARSRGAVGLPSRRPAPALGKVDMGDLGSPYPVSMDFGFDRGQPIDRYYVERFLERHAGDVRGTVLEIGENAYSHRIGGDRVERQEILDNDARNPNATLIGDIADPAVLRNETFDCMILTQTLHFIYDFRGTIKRIHAALKPGGVVLLTVPGISQIDRGAWGANWYWAFTHASIQRLFTEVFGEEAVHVEHHGNVFAATAFLQGLAVSEVDVSKLDVVDDAYQVIVAVRAQRAA